MSVSVTPTVKPKFPAGIHALKATGWQRRDLIPERGMTVWITEGCLTLIVDNNEVQELLEDFYKVK